MNRLLLPFLILSTSLLPAQDPSPNQPTPASSAREKPAPVFVSVDFPGGTLAEFVAALRDKEPKVNVILAPLAADAKLPRIELKGAGIEQALEASCTVAESKALIRMKSFRGQGEPVFTVLAQAPVMTMKGPDGEVRVPVNLDGPPVDPAPAAKPFVEVFSLQDVIAADSGYGVPLATVLSALEAAVGGESQGTRLRFHKESCLLIAAGDKSQLQVVRSVLFALENDVKQRRHDKRPATEPGKEPK